MIFEENAGGNEQCAQEQYRRLRQVLWLMLSVLFFNSCNKSLIDFEDNNPYIRLRPNIPSSVDVFQNLENTSTNFFTYTFKVNLMQDKLRYYQINDGIINLHYYTDSMHVIYKTDTSRYFLSNHKILLYANTSGFKTFRYNADGNIEYTSDGFFETWFQYQNKVLLSTLQTGALWPNPITEHYTYYDSITYDKNILNAAYNPYELVQGAYGPSGFLNLFGVQNNRLLHTKIRTMNGSILSSTEYHWDIVEGLINKVDVVLSTVVDGPQITRYVFHYN
jgi:hypothetical protein